MDEYNALKSLAVLAVMILALLFLYRRSRKKSIRKIEPENRTAVVAIPDEVVAAIAMVLNEAPDELHDENLPSLPLRKASCNDSPWNAKIFGLRQLPTKRTVSNSVLTQKNNRK
ncbi:MAG: hypothetical protein LBB85_07980 [Dysgonamonadaceae bacterium]|nr:hypothetical protein [Dysgonamonadaceae bacterium]